MDESETLLRAANRPSVLDELRLWMGLAAMLSFLGVVAQFVYQCYLFLREGHWTAFPATEMCARYLRVQWCAYPTDWVGVHTLMSSLSAPGLLLIASGALAWLLFLRA